MFPDSIDVGFPKKVGQLVMIRRSLDTEATIVISIAKSTPTTRQQPYAALVITPEQSLPYTRSMGFAIDTSVTGAKLTSWRL